MMEYYFFGCKSTTMHEYGTVRPTGILLCATKRIRFVPFLNFPGNPSASLPNFFDNPFCHRNLFSFSFFSLYPFIVVLILCLNPQLCLQGTMVRVHLQFLRPFYVFLLEFSAPYDFFLSHYLHLFSYHGYLVFYHLWRSPSFYIFRCFHICLTWLHPWRSPRSSYLCLRLRVGAFFLCGIAGYLFITFAHTCSVFFSTSLSLPLCLLVDCCYDTLGITFNSSASFISSVLCVSFIVAKGVFGVVCFNASTKSGAANVLVSADGTLGIFKICGNIP